MIMEKIKDCEMDPVKAYETFIPVTLTEAAPKITISSLVNYIKICLNYEYMEWALTDMLCRHKHILPFQPENIKVMESDIGEKISNDFAVNTRNDTGNDSQCNNGKKLSDCTPYEVSSIFSKYKTNDNSFNRTFVNMLVHSVNINNTSVISEHNMLSGPILDYLCYMDIEASMNLIKRGIIQDKFIHGQCIFIYEDILANGGYFDKPRKISSNYMLTKKDIRFLIPGIFYITRSNSNKQKIVGEAIKKLRNYIDLIVKEEIERDIFTMFSSAYWMDIIYSRRFKLHLYNRSSNEDIREASNAFLASLLRKLPYKRYLRLSKSFLAYAYLSKKDKEYREKLIDILYDEFVARVKEDRSRFDNIVIFLNYEQNAFTYAMAKKSVEMLREDGMPRDQDNYIKAYLTRFIGKLQEKHLKRLDATFLDEMLSAAKRLEDQDRVAKNLKSALDSKPVLKRIGSIVRRNRSFRQ